MQTKTFTGWPNETTKPGRYSLRANVIKLITVPQDKPLSVRQALLETLDSGQFIAQDRSAGYVRMPERAAGKLGLDVILQPGRWSITADVSLGIEVHTSGEKATDLLCPLDLSVVTWYTVEQLWPPPPVSPDPDRPDFGYLIE